MSQDASLPRVIDHWLGGPQHTPADVAEGDRLAGLHPELPRLYQAQRAFQRATLAAWWDAGITQILVFQAGLPTAGHAHEQLTEAKVYYTDEDFDVVQPGAGLLAGVRRRVRYQTLDAADPEALADLEYSPIIHVERPTGILMIGAMERQDDATLGKILGNLADWAQPGSRLAFTHAGPGAASLLPFFEGRGQAFHLRDAAAVGALLGAWTPEAAPRAPEGGPTWLLTGIAGR